jgi:hypothetical protein
VATLRNVGITGENSTKQPLQLSGLSIVKFSSPKMEKISQIIENRYIDEDKLLGICMNKFGPGNYKLRVSLPSLLIEVMISDSLSV